jgi:serine kinase of HPr protein (carbohydrate metabolism regulator)
MTIKEITEIIDGKVICCEEKQDYKIDYAFASDLMSDVLTVEKENMLLITGLANLQAIRTSEMSDINCIIFARDKKIGAEMIEIARENKMILIESPHSVFHISGELYRAGIKSVY